MLLVLVSTGTAFAAGLFQVTQITDTELVDQDPQVSGDRVVWESWDGTDWEIYTWKAGALNATRITDNSGDDRQPQVSGDRVVWFGQADTGQEIFAWTPTQGTVQLTSDGMPKWTPQISGNRLVWLASDGTNHDVFTWKVGDQGLTRLTDDARGHSQIRVSGDRVVWTTNVSATGDPTSGNSVWTWKLGDLAPIQLSDDSINSQNPEVSGDRVVWNSWGGIVYLWQAGDLAATALTDGAQQDWGPAISGDRVAWSRDDSDGEVMTMKLGDAAPTQLTFDTRGDIGIQISGDRLVWQSSQGSDSDIYTWKAGDAAPTLVTDGTLTATVPQVSGDRIVWQAGQYFGIAGYRHLDIYTAVPPKPTRFEQSDGRFYYSPAWHTSSYWRYSGGSEKYSSILGASVYVPFRGTRLDWITKTNSALGIASVSVDGGVPVSVDLYSSVTIYQKKVWSTGDLPNGLHWVKIVHSGLRNPKSSGVSITMDAVDVVGTLVAATRYQESEPAVITAGTWSTAWSWSYSGGKTKSTSVRGSSVTVNFDGAKLNLLAAKGRYSGKAWVSLDGGPRVLVDLYSYTSAYKQVVYSTGYLAPGPHTVTISYSGYKNAASRGYGINVDAFDITGELGAAGPS
jgi:hypothetical protein